MKKQNKTLGIIVSAVALILIIAIAAIFGVLVATDTIKANVNPFLLMLTILTLGSGIYVIGYSIVVKGGYEYAVGGVLSVIGVILLLVTLKVNWIVTVIVSIAALAIVFVGLFLIKAKFLNIERTNESEDFVSYEEQRKKEKEEKAAKEEELPEIKSFKD